MAKIWHPNNEVSLETVNAYNNDTIHASLDISFTEISDSIGYRFYLQTLGISGYRYDEISDEDI